MRLRGFDGVFGVIWNAPKDYAAWTILLLDDIDHITQDSN